MHTHFSFPKSKQTFPTSDPKNDAEANQVTNKVTPPTTYICTENSMQTHTAFEPGQ